MGARENKRLHEGETFINRVDNTTSDGAMMSLSQHKSRRQTILELMVELMGDGLPRSPPDIQRKTKVTKLDSLLHQMWQKGDLLASQIVSAYTLEERRGKYKWIPRRMRFYVIGKYNTEVILAVEYTRWNPLFRVNETIKEKLIFKKYSRDAISHKDPKSAKITKELQTSDIALFPDEISNKIQVPKNDVTKALSYLKNRDAIYSKGWFNPIYGKETPFDRGYLWFIKTEQYDNRLKKHDVLTDRRQRIYERIKSNSETGKRFTSKTELFGGSTESRKEKIMKTLCSIYTDIVSKEIAGQIFYYIKDTLTEEEIRKQTVYWQNLKESKSSVFSNLGHAHEDFCGYAIQKMWDNHDFKVQNMDWQFHITKDGEKKFNEIVPKLTDPRKLAEFDRVLYIDFAPLSSKIPRRIYMIFESRYKRDLSPQDWDEYLRKIGDTIKYGTVIQLKNEHGHLVRVLAPKANVIPVMIVPHVGKAERGQNFARYVVSKGGIVLFTSEFEAYLRRKTGKSFAFKTLFSRWFKTELQRKKFAQYLMEFFGQEAIK